MLSSLNQNHFFSFMFLITKFLMKTCLIEEMKLENYITTDDGLTFIARGHAHRILFFKEGIIMSLGSEHKVCVWNETDGLKDFIGCGKEGSLMEKLYNVSYISHLICVELDNIVYVADYKLSCIKITSAMMHTTKFLSAVRKLMRAFSIHEKRGKVWFQQFSSWLVFTGITLLKCCLKFL